MYSPWCALQQSTPLAWRLLLTLQPLASGRFLPGEAGEGCSRIAAGTRDAGGISRNSSRWKMVFLPKHPLIWPGKGPLL